jgi:hypothetical protein
MAIFGYSKRVATDHGLHELSEVTFDVSLEDLRRIARFLIDCAENAESGDWRSSHRHFTEFDHEWDHDHPSSDVIVLHPRPAPPRRVVDGGKSSDGSGM